MHSKILILCMREKGGDTSWIGEFLPFLMAGVCVDFKSVNLQYNTLGRWAKRLINQASDVPSIIFLKQFLAKKIVSIYFFFINLQK